MKDPAYGYRIINGSICNADLNSDGFREREIVPKNDNEYLIIVVGDSLVYGRGLLIKDRFTNLLQAKLNKIRETRVLNLGTCGNNIYQNLIISEKYRKNLSPDLIILAISINDLLIDKSLTDSPYSESDIEGRKIIYNLTPNEKVSEYSERVIASFTEESMNYQMLTTILTKMKKEKTINYLLTFDRPEWIHHKMINEFRSNYLNMIDNFDLYNSKYIKYADSKLHFRISKKEGHPNSMANQMFSERLFQEIVYNPRWGFIQTNRQDSNKY